MYPAYVSRKYLEEKRKGLEYALDCLETDNLELPDKVETEDIEKVRYAIQSYCNALLNEFGWKISEEEF